MKYLISCECGGNVEVAETDAGSKMTCFCGRTVVVPSLRELRRIAGGPEASPSPELEVETLLLSGSLPEEEHCVLCGVATDHLITSETECERAHVQDGGPGWGQWFFSIFFLFLTGWLVWKIRGQEREWGKDRIFYLPLRVCSECELELTGTAELRDALCQVALYRRLLRKYPAAKLRLVTANIQKPSLKDIW